MSRADFYRDSVLIRLEDLAAQRRFGGIWGHLAGKFPAVILATGFIGGLISGRFFSIRLYIPVLACCSCLCLWLFVRRLVQEHRRLIAVMVLSAVVMFCLGIVRMEYWKRPAANDLSVAIGQSPSPALLRGYAASDIIKSDDESWVFGTFMPGGGGGGSFYLDVAGARATDGWVNAGGCVRVQVGGRPPAIKAGDSVEICCVLSGFEGPANPWQFDVKSYMQLRGVCGAAKVEGPDGIETLNAAGGGWPAKALSAVRRRAFDALIADGPEVPDERSGLAEALLLGRRGKITASTFEAFSRTGLAHFISLSGMHVGILAGVVWLLGRLIGLGRRGSAALTLIVILLFGMVVPPRAPTLRGIALCVFFCFGLLLGRRVRPLNTLAVAAIVLLLFRPADLFTVGWQLSYMTVLGITLFYGPLRKFVVWNGLGRAGWFCSAYGGGGIKGVGAWILLWFAGGICVGFAAWIGGAGVLLWHFGTITAGTTLWTVLLLPVVTGILFVGFAKIAIGLLLPSAGAALGVVLIWLSGLFLDAVKWISRWDFLSFSIGQVPLWTVLSYYGFVGLLRGGMSMGGRVRVFRLAAMLLLACAAVFGVGAVKIDGLWPGRLEMWCLSVGHGQAIVARMPAGQTIMFDIGSISVKDVGRRVAGPFLKSRGIRHIDAIVISHGDIDHFNGLPEVVQMFDVDGVYVNDSLADRFEQTAAGKTLRDSLSEAGVKISGMEKWPEKFGSVQVKSLWPVGKMEPGLSENDLSEVMMIEWAGRKILLCGDIEQYGQGRILELYPLIKADVVVMPHHGSARNLLPEFVRGLGAKTVLASCGRTEALSAYQPGETEDIQAYYTGRYGAIRTIVLPDGTMKITRTKTQEP